jgi:iron(III) transport system ATP-binding protein
VPLTDPDDASACLRGMILHSAFRGRGYDHVVRLPDGGVLSEIFASHSHRREQAVGLRIDPDGCISFPAEAPRGPRREACKTRSAFRTRRRGHPLNRRRR